MDKNRNLVSLDQIESGVELKISIQELFDKVKDINPEAYRLIADKIMESDLDPKLYNMILEKSAYDDTGIKNRLQSLEEIKANRSELLDYRRLDVDITEDDLEKELKDKINILYEKGYDDRWVVEAINRLDRVKFNRYEANNFRRIETPITLEDLDHQLHDLLYDIQSVVDIVNLLQESAVSKEYLLENYRRKVIDINYDDLSVDLQSRLNNYTETVNLVENKFVILDSVITDILDTLNEKANQTDVDLKADKTDVDLKADIEWVEENFRNKEDKIVIADLDTDIAERIENISPEFNSETVLSAIADLQKLKADKSYLDNFLRRTDPICENDLDYRLIEKINRAIDKYDDTDVIAHIKNLQLQKVDIRDLHNYRRKEIKIELDDLSPDIRLILNSHIDDNAEIKSLIASIKYLQDNKLTKDQAGEIFLKKDDIIKISNIDTTLLNKIDDIIEVNRLQEQLLSEQRELIESQNKEIEDMKTRIRFNELEIERIKGKIGMN